VAHSGQQQIDYIVTDFLTVYGRHTERFLSPSLTAIAPSCYIFLFIGTNPPVESFQGHPVW